MAEITATLVKALRDRTGAGIMACRTTLTETGGDLDAAWEDVNDSGSETVAGDNPTPDQSLVEENARAVGVTYEDNEELEFIDKITRRDRERFELDEGSKSTDDMI